MEGIYAKGLRRTSVRKITQSLFAFNNKSFKEFVDERGAHVHKVRYDDKKLSRIEAMERLSISNPDAAWSSYLYDYFETTYKHIRREKVKELLARNRVVRNILDEYFERLYPVVGSSSLNRGS